MLALQNANSRTPSEKETGTFRKTCTCSLRTCRPQDGDSGLISLLSEDEDEDEEQASQSHFVQEVTYHNSVQSNADGTLGLSPSSDNQVQLDRQRRQSRASRQSNQSRRDRSRSRSPVGSNSASERDRDSSNGSRRCRPRTSASSTCSQTSASPNGPRSRTSTRRNRPPPLLSPGCGRRIRQINLEGDSSSQVDTEVNNSNSDSDNVSELHNTSTSTEVNSRIATSPHDNWSGYSSSDDSYLYLGESAEDWWRDIASQYTINYTTDVTYSTDGSFVAAGFIP